MDASVTPLRVVRTPDAPRHKGHVAASPETRLRALFRREARLEGQLLEVRQAIAAERKRYAERHRLGFFPTVDRLRGLFG